MARIVFFSIPAHGHTNPTIEVIHQLTRRGHTVRYYSFDMFRERIENAGAEFVSCDAYMPPMPKDFDRRAKYDFSSLIEMATRVTIAMESAVLQELGESPPDCIVTDSLCIWGKLFAKRLGIPMVCSTTSFAFNEHTAKMMKPGWREMLYSLAGIPKINRDMKLLREHGYKADNLVQLIQNDNETDTIVYTSRVFQPQNETFGERFAFVGPSLPAVPAVQEKKERPLVYISLGTVHRDTQFYQNCIEALRNSPYDVVMSAGDVKNIAQLKEIPRQFTIKPSVDQLRVLQKADVFVTHAGMNSVNESIYFGVPMVLIPQHSEQNTVALRAQAVGAGKILKSTKPEHVRAAIEEILGNRETYRNSIRVISGSFRSAGGPEKAADKIEQVMGGSGR